MPSILARAQSRWSRREHAFVTAFLASWGEALEHRTGRARRRARN